MEEYVEKNEEIVGLCCCDCGRKETEKNGVELVKINDTEYICEDCELGL